MHGSFFLFDETDSRSEDLDSDPCLGWRTTLDLSGSIVETLGPPKRS